MIASDLLQRLLGAHLIDDALASDLKERGLVQDADELERYLVESGDVREDRLTAFLANEYRLPFCRAKQLRIWRETATMVPREFALRHAVVPLEITRNVLTVAVTLPIGSWAEDYVQFLSGCIVRRVVVTQSDLQQIVEAAFSYSNDIGNKNQGLLWPPESPNEGLESDFPFYGRDDSLQSILEPDDVERQLEEVYHTIGCFGLSGQSSDAENVNNSSDKSFFSSIEQVTTLGGLIDTHPRDNVAPPPAPEPLIRDEVHDSLSTALPGGMPADTLMSGEISLKQAYSAVIEGLRLGATHIAFRFEAGEKRVEYRIDGRLRSIALDSLATLPGQLVVADVVRLIPHK